MKKPNIVLSVFFKNNLGEQFSKKSIIYLLYITVIVFFYNTAYSQVNPIWQVSFNDSLPEDNFAVKSKVDSENNIVILARGSNSSLGTGVDFIVVKYNSEGVKLWNRRFDGTGHGSDYPSDLVIDRNNNIYVTGRSWGGATKNDYLTLKYSPDGDMMWSRRFDWLVSRNDEPYSMALDSNDNVIVTGFATYAFDGHDLSEMLTVKYNSSGDQIWTGRFRGISDQIDWGYTVVCDEHNNAIVSGFTYSDNLNFTDIVTIKYDSSGKEIWQRRFYNNGDDFIRPLMSKVDHSNNIIIVSYYKGDSTRIDYLTYKYDSSGNLLWSKIYDGQRHNDWVHDFLIDNQNNIYVIGSCAYDTTGFDYLTIKYSAAGQELWHRRLNDSMYMNSYSNDLAASIATDMKGNIFIFGTSYFSQYYGCILILNSSGYLLYKLKNYNFHNAISILSDEKNDIIISGINGNKIYTAKYLNTISGIICPEIESNNFSHINQNYPNPFNPRTIIKYQISKLSFVSLKVYDILGSDVAALVDEYKSQGTYNSVFEADKYPSGIYFYSLYINGKLTDTKRMLLIK